MEGLEKRDTGGGVDTLMIETHLSSLRKNISCLQWTGWIAGENLIIRLSTLWQLDIKRLINQVQTKENWTEKEPFLLVLELIILL